MKQILTIIQATLIIIVATVSFAHADLDSFLSDLNREARSDIQQFHAVLSAQFQLPLRQAEAIVDTVRDPADAFMCLQLSKMTGIKLENVLQKYQSSNKRGWGALAKELGIKPGSPAFHALKDGDFVYGMQTKKQKKEKVKGKGKGKSKGNK